MYYYFKAFYANSLCSEVTYKQIKYSHFMTISYTKKLPRTVYKIEASNCYVLSFLNYLLESYNF